jgi:hypothetical protein
MKVTPDFVPAIGGHGHRPQMQDLQARGLRTDQPTFPQVAAQVRAQIAAGPPDATEGPGKSASSPAHQARAAIFASGAQSSVPFGSIVSAIARGLELPVLDPDTDAATAPEAPEDAGDGVGAAEPDEAAAGISEPVPVESDDDTGPTVNPLEEAMEQVADNLGSGSAEAAMADILDELLDTTEAAA